jgi:hypothetical protein
MNAPAQSMFSSTKNGAICGRNYDISAPAEFLIFFLFTASTQPPESWRHLLSSLPSSVDSQVDAKQ